MKVFERKTLENFWTVLAAVLLSLAWLLPNHTRPWISFHAEAWCGAIFSGAVVISLFRKAYDLRVSAVMISVAGLIFLPILQLAIGTTSFSGEYWVGSIYLLGFLIAVFAGSQWQEWCPTKLGDIIFLGVGVASIFSVGLQLQQWFGTAQDGMLDIWIANGARSSRPSANISQANQLGTLLLWGLLSCGWGIFRKRIGAVVACFFALFLVVGVALTQSRTAALGLFLLLIASWHWRLLLGSGRKIPLFFSVLVLAYACIALFVPYASQLLLLDSPPTMLDRSSTEIRLQVWRMLLDAASQRPLLGYGWNQTFSAQLLVSDQYSPLGSPFLQAHNLFIDLILWSGFPVGVALCLGLCFWLFAAVCRVRSFPQVIYLLMILVVVIHAMFEYPLSYSYFLIPVGVVVGVLGFDLNIWCLMNIPTKQARRMSVLIVGVGCVLFGLIIWDYSKIEKSYLSLELEAAGIRKTGSTALPHVVLLNQLREAQALSIFVPAKTSSATQVDWAKKVVKIAPSARNFMIVAILLGIDQRPNESRQWLVKMCKIVPKKQCDLAPQRWLRAQAQYPQLVEIQWPLEAGASFLNGLREGGG
jgi:O-antigen ligase